MIISTSFSKMMSSSNGMFSGVFCHPRDKTFFLPHPFKSLVNFYSLGVPGPRLVDRHFGGEGDQYYGVSSGVKQGRGQEKRVEDQMELAAVHIDAVHDF
jgi:hypothetical protein